MRENEIEDFDITLENFLSHTLGCTYNGVTEELKNLLAFIQELCYNEVELEDDIEMLCSTLFHVAENNEEKEDGLRMRCKYCSKLLYRGEPVENKAIKIQLIRKVDDDYEKM